MPIVKTRQDHVVFVVYGKPYTIPLGWVKSESSQTTNDVLIYSNPDHQPEVMLNRVNFQISIEVPCLSGEHLAKTRVLKTLLRQISNTLAAEQRLATPFRSQEIRNTKVELANAPQTLPGVVAMLCSYFGESMQMMSGYLESFHTTFDPSTKIDVWNITFAAQPLVNVRRKGPAKLPDGVIAGAGVATS